jgi:hypothetical protein
VAGVSTRPASPAVLGISAQRHSRSNGAEGTRLPLWTADVETVRAACPAFTGQPYFAIVVEKALALWASLRALDHLAATWPGDAKLSAWQTTQARPERSSTDPGVQPFELRLFGGVLSPLCLLGVAAAALSWTIGALENRASTRRSFWTDASHA